MGSLSGMAPPKLRSVPDAEATTLPQSVIDAEREHEEAIGYLRWHWTLDPDNPGCISFSEYARQTDADRSNVRTSARRYAERFCGGVTTKPVDRRGGKRLSRRELYGRKRLAKYEQKVRTYAEDMASQRVDRYADVDAEARREVISTLSGVLNTVIAQITVLDVENNIDVGSLILSATRKVEAV